MTARQVFLEEIARSHGLMAVAPSAGQRRMIDRLVSEGELVRLFPGVVCLPEVSRDPETWIRAAMLWKPQAVVTGAAAARMLFWPQHEVSILDLLVPGSQWSGPHAMAHRCAPPPGHLVTCSDARCGTIRFTDVAYTCVWLAAKDGGAAIETALRSGRTTPEQLEVALGAMANRPGNGVRREVVRWSRHKPWSHFERRVHRILLQAGIRGWEGNWWWKPPGDADGVIVDIAFVAERVALELDGYEFHHTREAWARDVHKTNALQLAGWTVLHFTWSDLERPDWMVEQVRLALHLSLFR